MNTIRIAFEYHCHPIWVYDENGSILCNDLPEPLQHHQALCQLCQQLQNRHDALFLDDGKAFDFLGFQTEQEQQAFQRQVDALYQLLVSLCGDGYRILAPV